MYQENNIEICFFLIISEMDKINMEKRISSRGIIIEDDCVYVMFRRRTKEDGSQKEYYVILGGGINENETLEENGTPTLGGEELERCTESNYYEIRKVPIKELENIDILSKDIILKAYLNE